MSSDEQLFEPLAKRAQADGAQIELMIERAERLSVSFQKGKMDKFDSSVSHCAGLRVIGAEGYAGYSFSEDLRPAALEEAYRDALANAKFTAQGGDPEARISLFDGSGGEPSEMSALFNTSLSVTGVEAKLETARTLESAALEADSRVASVPYNSYNETESELRILTSAGIRRRQRRTSVYGYSYCLAAQGEERRTGGESFFLRDLAKLDPREIARKAASLAVGKLGAAPPQSGRYPVVIDREVVAELFSLISDYFSARAVFEKSSLFAGELGKQVASSKLRVTDDPFYPGGTNTRSFDSEGSASRVTPVIEGGRLMNFLTNSVYAKRMKLPHTSSASRGARSELGIGMSNFVVEAGKSSFESLLGSAPKVVYVTDLTGYHAGFQEGTGDFSLQAEGELWENGKKARALCDFLVVGNIRDLLMGIEEVSSRIEAPKAAVIAPDLLIRELSIASGS